MLQRLRWWLIGSPLPTQQDETERLSNQKALAVFSPDALSSIAYANQEIYLSLAVAGSAALAYSFPISIVIVGLLVIVSLSYFQTIQGYPSGGGSYIVASENLGTFFGLVAGAALMLDYLLAAAVSLSASVAAIASVFPALWQYRVILALFLLAIITLINLRGLQETGKIISVPVYIFLISYAVMLIYGVFQVASGRISPVAYSGIPATEPITLFLLLHAFSTGCTALTGIEAISNGVQAFKPPEAKNAEKTLLVMAAIMGTLFLGSIGLTQYLGVAPSDQETILSALARHIFGEGFFHIAIQIATMSILLVAANTSFAGFPRISSILAKDGFLPRPFMAIGDRLVFSNGITVLSITCGILLIAFNANTHNLVPLFAVGAFLAFSLSQAGMVVHWWKTHNNNWLVKAVLNGVGAILTTVTLLVIGITKFIDGAWISLILIAGLVYGFYQIKNHYREIAKDLTLHKVPPSLKPFSSIRIVMPVSGLHSGVIEGVRYAKTISSNITAVNVEIEPNSGEKLQKVWNEWFPDIPLVIVPSPYRSIIGPFLNFLDEKDATHHDGQLSAVLIPEFIPAKWWEGFLHNQTAWSIRLALLYRRRRLGYQRMIIDAPIHLKH